MKAESARAIYAILVEECRAPQGQEEAFIAAHVNGEPGEWRFKGDLGHGGKFYSYNKWRGGCYEEDRTPERDAMIERANCRLLEIP